MHARRNTILCAALALLAATVAAPAAEKAGTRGAVELSDGTIVPQNLQPPKLHLTGAQREKIRQVMAATNSQIEFKLKSTKKAKDFQPALGAKLPKGVKPEGIPQQLIVQMPQLSDYGYVKMKNRVLLVNAMTGKIAAMIPEVRPQTTGQP